MCRKSHHLRKSGNSRLDPMSVLSGANHMRTNIGAFLLATAVLSLLYAIICSNFQARKAHKIVRRIKEQHPDVWLKLPWIYRKILNSEVALLKIWSAQLMDRTLLKDDYAEVQKYNWHILLSSFFALGLIVLVVSI